MGSRITLTLYEGNTETVDVTITRAGPGDDLTGVTALEMLIKADACTPDNDPGVIVLSTTNPAQILITSQSAQEIIARVVVPPSALAVTYTRWWRLDALAGTARRTAAYGPLITVDL